MIEKIDFKKYGAISGDIAKQIISKEFWEWYEQNKGKVVLRKKIFMFSVSITLEDLYPVFVTVFGEPK